jgi:hypothetical protein
MSLPTSRLSNLLQSTLRLPYMQYQLNQFHWILHLSIQLLKMSYPDTGDTEISLLSNQAIHPGPDNLPMRMLYYTHEQLAIRVYRIEFDETSFK